MKKRLLALLLALALVVSLFGCQKPQNETPSEPTAPSTEPTEPAPDAAQIYADAAAALSAGDVTLDVTSTKTTTFGSETLTEETSAVLTYTGMGTENPQSSWVEATSYWDLDDEQKVVATEAQYQEVYADGTLYIELKDKVQFSAPLAAEDLANRYVPAVLMDISLYEDVTVTESGDTATITFASPTAAEVWAMPADAELVEASGTATVTGGKLTAMAYTVTYDYGSVSVTWTTESKPRAQAEAVTLPPEAARYMYTPLQSPDALWLFLQTENLKDQAVSGTFTDVSSMFSQAAGVVRNQVQTVDFYDTEKDMMAKFMVDIYLMDYANNADDSYTQEENYQNGKYVYTVNDGVPTTINNDISKQQIRDYYRQILLTSVLKPEYWADVAVEDLGSLYYMEFTFNESFGNMVQNGICSTFWEDPGFLNSLASAYTTDEVTGYMSVDKFTGLPVASGYKYQGTHTIDGTPYILTNQLDQSFTLPSLGAYKEITDKMPPEAEPENKATPLFYHVTGDNGQEMWLFGTIHVGDNRTAYLPQEIYDAFAASDALAIECDTEAFDEQMDEDEELSDQVSDLYFYDDGTTIADHIDEELYTKALKYVKATGNYNMNAEYMKPSIWSQGIDNFFMRQGQTLTSEQGVEERLTKLAHEQEKPILEVESSLFQIQMMTGWSEELHEELLAGSVEYTGADHFDGVNELFEMWCEGNEETLREYLSDEVDTSELTEEELAEYEAQKDLLDEYNTAMSYDRNDGMLKKAIEYLESGDVIFYAVGLAHLLNDYNGLVDTLREAGYTVELVPYA